jgi:hypothetical protein
MRPSLADVERYLDDLEAERSLTRWLLEDIACVEDSPETDDDIESKLAHERRNGH